MNDQQLETIATNIRRAKFLRLSWPTKLPDNQVFAYYGLEMQFADPKWVRLHEITALAREFF